MSASGGTVAEQSSCFNLNEGNMAVKGVKLVLISSFHFLRFIVGD